MTKPIPNPAAKFGRRLASIERSDPMALAWAPAGESLIIYSSNTPMLTHWRPADDKTLWTISYPGSFERPILFTGDGSYILAWGANGPSRASLTILDPLTGRPIQNISGSDELSQGQHITSVAASPDGQRIAFHSFTPSSEPYWTLSIYVTNGWRKVIEYRGEDNEKFSRLVFTPDSRRIVSASMQLPKNIPRNYVGPWSLAIRVHDAENGRIISNNSEVTMSMLNKISISPDGKDLAIGLNSDEYNPGEDTNQLLRDTLVIYSVDSNTQIRSYPRLSKSTNDVSWNQYDSIILAQELDKIALWDSQSNQLYDILNNYPGVAAKFRPDGRAVAYIDAGHVVVREINIFR